MSDMKAPDCFIVCALKRSPNGNLIAEAVAIDTEWEAHDVAELVVALGARSFFIDTKGEDGESTIEEYSFESAIHIANPESQP